MASNVQQSTVVEAAKYWFEQIPYTETYDSIGGTGSANAGNLATVFALQGWTTSNAPDIYAELTAVGATPQPGLQLRVNADQQQTRFDLGGWPGRLRPVPLRQGGVLNLAAQLVNTTGQALTNQQLTYLLTVWRMPVAFKILRGLPLTAADRAIAEAAQLSLNPVTARGTLPYTWETIIAETYANRQLDPAWQFSGSEIATSNATRFHHAQTGPNQVLILRSIGATAPFGSGTTITVDRDTEVGHLQLDAGALDVTHPLPMFVPAKDHLTFSLSATSPPAGPIPIRIEIWTVALSTILAVRLGLLSEAELQRIAGAKTGAHQYAMILGGRM